MQEQRLHILPVNGEIKHGAMNGVALERSEIRFDRFPLQRGRPSGQPVADIVVERLVARVLEDEVGQLAGFVRADRQVEGYGSHDKIVTGSAGGLAAGSLLNPLAARPA